MNNGLGDLEWKSGDPVETYFDLVRMGVKLPRRKWIVKPDFNPLQECRIPGMEAMQKFFECHAMPRLWQLMSDLWTKLQCGTYFTKGPNWNEAPITARSLDIRTDDCVVVPAGYVAEGFPVLTFTVPDRFVGSILGFGHAVQNPVHWPLLQWTIEVNSAPLPTYQDWKGQIGEFHRPTPFPNTQKLKHQDKVRLLVKNPSGTDACVFGRFYAFMFPSMMLTQDGSFRDYHTL